MSAIKLEADAMIVVELMLICSCCCYVCEYEFALIQTDTLNELYNVLDILLPIAYSEATAEAQGLVIVLFLIKS